MMQIRVRNMIIPAIEGGRRARDEIKFNFDEKAH